MSKVCAQCNNLSAGGHDKSESLAGAYHLSLSIYVSDLQLSCKYCVFLKTILRHFVLDLQKHSGDLQLQVDLGDNAATNIQVYRQESALLVTCGLLRMYLPNKTQCKDLPHLGSLGSYSTRSDSPACYEFIRQRIKTCTNSHEACTLKTSLPTPLPRRILSIGESNSFDDICLLETSGQSAKYAALSHCWGKHQPIRTFDDNLEAMKRSIAWASLSNVFQDAVRACRDLGLHYIWIDSLCIIQDNEQDWEIESAKMGDYYENAFITISATSSPDGTHPFHIERASKWWPEPFDFVGSDGTTSKIIIRRHEGSSLGSYLEDVGPLATRAWVWQETILSTRVVHYLQSELIWDCKTEVISEDGAMPRGLFSMRLPQQLARCKTDPLSGWHELLRTYTARLLTYETDRLPALSGVASRFQLLAQSEYLAGLWRDYLPLDLCWEVDHQVSEFSTAQLAPSQAIAPSWSWASVNGSIFFHDLDLETPFQSMCHVEDVRCSVPGRNPFGRVVDGYLRLRGPLVEIQIKCSDPRDPWAYTIGDDPDTAEPFAADSILTITNGSVKRAAKGDELASFSTTVPCMLVGKEEGNDLAMVHVMVLERIGVDRYTRLGVANLDDSQWFNGASEKIISII